MEMKRNVGKCWMPFGHPLPWAILFCAVVFAGSPVAQDRVLVVRPDGRNFAEVIRGVKEELRTDFVVSELVTSKATTPGDLAASIGKTGPRVVVLMDNRNIALFGEYQKTLPETAMGALPSVSLMGVLVEKAIADLKNASGISYEIPIVTSAVKLRNLGVPIKKIGVLYRELMKDFIDRNEEYCTKESIALARVSLPSKSSDFASEIGRGVERLCGREMVDAIWIPNDNALLNADLIRDTWIPRIKEARIPVIVGVEVLVNPELDLGTFAVLPDHVAMGTQAAGMIYEIRESGWHTSGKVEPPLSVYQIINGRHAKRYRIRDDKLQTVDKIAH
jgi:hypothetical protein